MLRSADEMHKLPLMPAELPEEEYAASFEYGMRFRAGLLLA
jgi:hypothetical protein